MSELDPGTNTQKSDAKENSWFQTYSGIRFYPWRPTVEMVTLDDIAHHTSQMNRWAGATRYPLSVAQHLVMAWQLACFMYPDNEDVRRWALMHDSGEAYVMDLIRPVKRFFPEYRELENGVLQVIAEKFDLPWPMPEEVHLIDNLQLAIENEFVVHHKIPGLYEDLFNEFKARVPTAWMSSFRGSGFWFIPDCISSSEAEQDFLLACHRENLG